MLVGKPSIGIMQGRLTPSRGRGIQFFPFEGWDAEFSKAAQIGLDEIEFIFDLDRYTENPIWTKSGRERIKKLISSSGVRVNHVCADFFMRRPFFGADSRVIEENIVFLKILLYNSAEIGAVNVEIPILDNSSLKTDEDEKCFVNAVGDSLSLAERLGLTISIEADLEPLRLLKLVKSFNSSSVFVVYDSGNSASLGYDCKEELNTLGSWIKNVHIKDRVRNGVTVTLGSGSVDFDRLFSGLKDINYQGGFTLQVARGSDGDEVETVKAQLNFLRRYIRM